MDYNEIKRIKQTIKRVPTSDDWSPSIDDSFVLVKCSISAYIRNKSRKNPRWTGEATYYCAVTVWGDDDTGRELVLKTENPVEAEAFYAKWSAWITNLALIDFKELSMLGFVGA